MTAAIVYKRIHHYRRAFPDDTQLQSIPARSYYQIYQLKLQEWVIDPQFQAKSEKKSPKRSTKESMNYPTDKLKSPIQNECPPNKRASSVLSANSRHTKGTSTPTEVSVASVIPSNEPRPKSILKTTKRSSSQAKHPRIISAPANSHRNPRRKAPIQIPTIEIDYPDEDLSKSNAHSYTEVSSSTQNSLDKTNQYARQSALKTIVLHLHAFGPADLSMWNLYRDFDEKFSASISPRVYRDFERIIL